MTGSTGTRSTPTATGLVGAPANEVNARCRKATAARSASPVPRIDAGNARSPRPASEQITQPRIYYGERIRDYAIVDNRESGRRRARVRPPARRNYTYNGKRRHDDRQPVNRLAFATSTRSRTSCSPRRSTTTRSCCTSGTRATGCEKVAPFLTVDGDPYPAVIDGRHQWIVDGYTTAATYPYAERRSLRRGHRRGRAPGVAAAAERTINYIRNSVKATVDAYDGTVTLYRFDDDGPGAARRGTRRSRAAVQPGRGDPGRTPRAPALPGGPVQGPARPADQVPRHPPERVLLRPGLLAGAADPNVPDAPGQRGQKQPPYYLFTGLPRPADARRRSS